MSGQETCEVSTCYGGHVNPFSMNPNYTTRRVRQQDLKSRSAPHLRPHRRWPDEHDLKSLRPPQAYRLLSAFICTHLRKSAPLLPRVNPRLGQLTVATDRTEPDERTRTRCGLRGCRGCSAMDGLCGSASICIHQRILWLRQIAERRLEPSSISRRRTPPRCRSGPNGGSRDGPRCLP